MARVRLVSDNGTRVYFELRDGSTGTLDNPAIDLSVGDVFILVTDEDGFSGIELVDREVWPDDPWIGVVRLRLSDVTVIDSGGRLRRVPTSEDIPYQVGNTVEAGDFTGVIRVVSADPIKYLDLPGVDDADIQRFRLDDKASSGLTFEDFGGLPEVVKRAKELIETPLRRREELAEIGTRPIKGVLFTGAPGTGKTMLARIIAAQSGAAFYEVSGPAIFSKWYGQSEELLRMLFEAASGNGRAIIFFDEIDSVASQRDDTAHEASRRVVAQLLTLMDGFTPDSNVVVIATTNRPQDLDVALRRPGRFDWQIDFPLPNLEDRKDILVKSSKGLKTATSLPHSWMAAKTSGWSASDLAAIWTEAALLAVDDDRTALNLEDYVGGYERVAGHRRLVAQTGAKRE